MDSRPLQRRLGEMLQTDRLAIFLPLYLGLMISDRLGSENIPLGGDLALKGAPIGYLGLLISLVVLWATSSAQLS